MNASACIQLVKSCRDPVLAKRIHDQIRRTGYENDRLIANLIVEMYGKCGHVEEAKAAFDSIRHPNVFSATILLAAYAQNGYSSRAKAFFDGMRERNVYSWSTLITSFASRCDYEAALDVFNKMPARNSVACNSVVAAYSMSGDLDVIPTLELDQSTSCNALLWLALRNGDVNGGRELFERMLQRDIVSWNTLLQGYVEIELVEEAANVFERMPQHNSVSCTSVLSVFALAGDYGRGECVVSSILHWDVVAHNARLQFLIEFGLIEQALELFKKMSSHSVVTLTSIVTAYARSGHLVQAKLLFGMMPERNFVTWNSLLASYAQLGHVEVAEDMLKYIPQHSTMAWNSILKAHGDAGNVDSAKKTFDRLLHRSILSWNLTLDVYSTEAEVSLLVFGKMPYHDDFSWSVLILGASSSGNLDRAIELFNQMPYQNVLCWNALVQANMQNADTVQALHLFQESNLLGITPNRATFASVLTGLSHVGGLEDARSCFATMVRDYSIPASAAHYCSIVDLLGRAGQVKEAMDLIDNLPYGPMEVEWTTLLGASKTHGDYTKGVFAASKVIELETVNSAVYSLLTNICCLINVDNDVLM